MKIKFNWGTGIAIFVGIFILFILTFVYKCTQQNIDLVSTNYYDQEIQYQKQINRLSNSSDLQTKVAVVVGIGVVTIQFPDTFENSKLIGKIAFFKPDNAANDFEVTLKLNEKLTQQISTEKLPSGRWNIKISYVDGVKEYYSEEKILLN